MSFCKNCGAQLAEDSMFCEACGTRVAQTTVSVTEVPVPDTPEVTEKKL